MHGTFPLEMQRFLFSLFFEAAASFFLRSFLPQSITLSYACCMQGIDCRPTDSRTPVALFRGAGHRVALWLSPDKPNLPCWEPSLKRNRLENLFSLLVLIYKDCVEL